MKSSPKNNLALFNRNMIDATTDERASVKLVHSKHGWLASMKKYLILATGTLAFFAMNVSGVNAYADADVQQPATEQTEQTSKSAPASADAKVDTVVSENHQTDSKTVVNKQPVVEQGTNSTSSDTKSDNGTASINQEQTVSNQPDKVVQNEDPAKTEIAPVNDAKPQGSANTSKAVSPVETQTTDSKVEVQPTPVKAENGEVLSKSKEITPDSKNLDSAIEQAKAAGLDINVTNKTVTVLPNAVDKTEKQLQAHYASEIDYIMQTENDYENALKKANDDYQKALADWEQKQKDQEAQGNIDPGDLIQNFHLYKSPDSNVSLETANGISINKWNGSQSENPNIGYHYDVFIPNGIPSDENSPLVTATFTNINGSYTDKNGVEHKFSKRVDTWFKNTEDVSRLEINNDPTSGYWYIGNPGDGTMGVYHTSQYYDEQGNLINFSGNAYEQIASLNHQSGQSGPVEHVKVISGGNAKQIIGSTVGNHDDDLYSDNPNSDPDTWSYLPQSVKDELNQAIANDKTNGNSDALKAWKDKYYTQYNWDASTSDYGYFGAGIIALNGNKLVDYDYTRRHPSMGTWVIQSSTLQGNSITKPIKSEVPVPNISVDRTDIKSVTAEKAHVKYVDSDQNDKVLKNDDVNGHYGEKSDYSTQPSITDLENHGYELVNNDYPAGHVFDTDEPTYTVTLKHKVTDVTPDKPGQPNQPVDPNNPDGPKYPDGTAENDLVKTVTRTIHYQYDNGKEAAKDVIETTTFKRNASFDQVTGKVTYTNWNEPTHLFDEMDSPIVKGYTPNVNTVSALTVTPNSKDSNVTVVYNADKEVPSVSVTTPAKTTPNTSNPTGTSISQPVVKESGQAEPTTAQPAVSSSVETENLAQNEQSQAPKQGTLPKTGQASNNNLTVVGRILLGLSAIIATIGLGGKLKHKKD